MAIDVSPPKLPEATRSLHKLLWETIADTVVVLDAASVIRDANAALEQLFGHAPGDVIGQPLSMLQPERLRHAHTQGFGRYLATGDKRLDWRAVETTGLHRDGREIGLEISFSEAEVEGERLFVAVMRDVSRRQRAEDEMRAAVSQLEATLEATRDGLLVVSADGRRRFNQRFIEMWTFPDRPFDPRVTDSAIPHAAGLVADPDAFLARVREIVDRPMGESFDLLHLADGRVYERLSRPQIDGTLPIGRVWSFRDITARMRSEGVQAALHGISEAAHSAPDLPGLFEQIHATISGLMPARNFFVALHDPLTDMVSFPYFIDEFDPQPHPRPLSAGRGLTDLVLRTGESLLLSPETTQTTLELPDVDLIGTDGIDWLGVPLKTSRGTIGVLTVQSYSASSRYTEKDKELLQFVSDQVAAAVERKQAQQALIESEERFHSVFDQSPIIICLLSYPEGRFQEMNAAGLAAFGLAREELMGRTSVELEAWVDQDDRDTYLGLLREHGSARNFEARMRRRNGDIFTVLYSGSLVTLAGRRYSVNSLQDITQRKQAEAALQESEEQFKSAFENSAIGMALVGVDGSFRQVNQALCSLVGYSEPELLARRFQDITHAEDLDADRPYRGRLLDGSRSSYRIEKRYVHRDGGTVSVLLAVSVVRDESGAARHFIAQMEDITERKRAERWQQHYSSTLAMIMAEASMRDVLESIARFAEAQSGGMLCSILLTSPDGRRLSTGAAPSLPPFYSAAIDGGEILPDTGPCAAAAWRKEIVVVDDIDTQAEWPRWRDLAGRAGLRSCWTQPILSAGGRVLGTFALYRTEPSSPTAEDLDLVRQSAGLAALALERAQHHEDRRLAKVVFEQSIEGIMVTDLEDRVLMVNQSFEALTGYGSAELLGQPPGIIFDAERFDPVALAARREELATTGRWKGELWARRKAGDTYPMEMSIATVHSADGIPSHYISILTDISEQQIQAARIEQLAFYDSLTGLPNRALFLDRLEQTLASARRHGGRGAMLFLDLDRFKEINDSQGHAVGDMALAEVGRRLQGAARKEETLARLGGDEFVLIAENADHQAAVGIATRMQRVLAAPLDLAGHSYSVGASIGIAFYPEDGQTSEDLIKRTDIAMYRAKASGGGYRLYQAEMGAELEKRLSVAKRLGKAMEAGELQLYYQPQVELATGRLIGAEALLRWLDPERGFISPAEFIPIAEDRGMMGPLGDWVLAEACRQVNAWGRLGLRLGGRLAINVSALQMEDVDIVGRLLGIVHDAGLGPQRFELELTESSMMVAPDRAVDVLALLRAAGFGLSIDDFGTGYSSLAYLKRFAADQIKIDISFVRNMLTDSNDHAIVSTIIAMARSLGLRTTAEGVEEAGQADELRALGCDYAQGYHFGRPLPADEFMRDWLQAPSTA